MLHTGPDLWRGRRRDGRFARRYKRLIEVENQPDGCLVVLQIGHKVTRSVEPRGHKTKELHPSIRGEPELRTFIYTAEDQALGHRTRKSRR